MKEKACKDCKIIVHENKCPLCKGNRFTDIFKGKIFVLNEESEIAKKLDLKVKGEFAIKIG